MATRKKTKAAEPIEENPLPFGITMGETYITSLGCVVRFSFREELPAESNAPIEVRYVADKVFVGDPLKSRHKIEFDDPFVRPAWDHLGKAIPPNSYGDIAALFVISESEMRDTHAKELQPEKPVLVDGGWYNSSMGCCVKVSESLGLFYPDLIIFSGNVYTMDRVPELCWDRFGERTTLVPNDVAGFIGSLHAYLDMTNFAKNFLGALEYLKSKSVKALYPKEQNRTSNDLTKGQDLLSQIAQLANAARDAGYQYNISLYGNQDDNLPDLNLSGPKEKKSVDFDEDFRMLHY